MIYSIYHPISGKINHDFEPQMYEKIFQVEAKSLEHAFMLSQNDFNPEYQALGVRSTSIGDIIQSEEDNLTLSCNLVKGIGFQNVPSTWLTYFDESYVIPDPANYIYAD